MKDGTHDDRLVLALKLTSPLTGAPHFLACLIAEEAEGMGVGHAEGLGLAAELANLSGTGTIVPGLSTGKVCTTFINWAGHSVLLLQLVDVANMPHILLAVGCCCICCITTIVLFTSATVVAHIATFAFSSI